jgi:hypothetical protein
MVNVIKGVGVHPPPSPAQANFTLMTECTTESRRYYSVYSVGFATTYKKFKLMFDLIFIFFKLGPDLLSVILTLNFLQDPDPAILALFIPVPGNN